MTTKRQGNRPDRRIAEAGSINSDQLAALAKQARYVGSANHKLHPGNYGFVPSHNPRPSKSPCDDLRPSLKAEATKLFREGIKRGLVSAFANDTFPKYIWALDEGGQVYEAKTKSDGDYHGYRLGDDESEMRRYVTSRWKTP